MKDVVVNIQYFGVFRQFGDAVMLSVPVNSSIELLKNSLVSYIGANHKNLVDSSVFADDVGILSMGFSIDKDMSLSILPPVCGG